MVDHLKQPAKRPTVLIFHPALAPYRIDTFNAIAEIADLHLVLIKKNVRTQSFDQKALVEQLNFTPRYLDKNYKIFNKRMAALPYREVMGYEPDIVITSEFSPTTALITLYKFLSRKRFASVIWTDDNRDSVSADRPMRRFARRLLSPLADGWIFISEEARQLYAKRFGVRARSASVPIIRRQDDFIEKLGAVGSLADGYISKYGLAGKRVFLFVGRLVEEKGIDLLLEAFAKVRALHDDVALVIVGSGDKGDALAERAVELGLAEDVKFVGRFEGDPLLAWYRVGQVFALASRFEPFGAVVNEALLAGLPVIVSERAGSRSLVLEGVNGSVVSPENTAGFADAMSNWIKEVLPLQTGAPLQSSRMQITFDAGTQELRQLFLTLAKLNRPDL